MAWRATPINPQGALRITSTVTVTLVTFLNS
jgi:hypothetical protein